MNTMDYLFRVQTTVLSTPVSFCCGKVLTWHFPAWDGRQRWLFCELCLSFWFDMGYLGLSLAIAQQMTESQAQNHLKEKLIWTVIVAAPNPTLCWAPMDFCKTASPFILDLVQCHVPTFSVGFVHFSVCAFCKHQRCLFSLIVWSGANQLKNMLCHTGFDKKAKKLCLPAVPDCFCIWVLPSAMGAGKSTHWLLGLKHRGSPNIW